MKFPMANFNFNPSLSQKAPPVKEWAPLDLPWEGPAPHSLSAGATVIARMDFFYDSHCLGRNCRTWASVNVLGLRTNQNEYYQVP